MTRSSKKIMLASSALMATLGTASGFVPGRAAGLGLKQAAGRTPSTSSSTRTRQDKTAASMVFGSSLFEDGLFSGIFSGSDDVGETTLPQDPKADTEGRKKELDEQREEYKWRLEGTPIDMPYLDDFPPKAELPTFEWVRTVAGVLVRTLLGAVRGNIGIGEVIEALTDPEKASNFASRLDELIGDAQTNERPVDINDYNDLHAFPIKTPESLHDYEEDDAFARQRLQGANCVMIEKCSDATRAKLKILDEDESYSGLKSKVDSLKKKGKLFVVDHELLKDHRTSPLDEKTPKYLAKGIALFEATDDELLPIRVIGIQLTQGETATPIFTPGDGYNWNIATAAFEAADFIIHEVVSHLGNTHVVMEAPMVAMHRQLPKAHPINALMAPHFEGTALINWGAHELLMPVGGGVDKLTANNIEDSWDMVKKQTLKRISSDFSPIADFEARGMTKDNFPGRYMYRDYGLKYWEATHTWVKEYLDLYYLTAEDFNGDQELKFFLTELVQVGLHTWLEKMVIIPDKQWEAKKAFLAKYLASVIYTGSALHAAVNFPQQPLTSYVPNTPGSMYTPIPNDKEPRGFDEYLDCLPPLEVATSQVVLTNLLGSVIYTKIGDYEPDQFTDDRVTAPLQKFQQAIEDIETELVDENAFLTNAWKGRGKDLKDRRNFAYKILLPDNVPQSINI